MTDLVSVIMPAFEAAKYVGPAIRSLLRETDVALDIVVVDDGSTDRTAEIVAEIAAAHPTVRLVRTEHRGVAAARNAGLAAIRADSRHVTFLDADDHSYPGRIRRQLDRLDGAEGAGFVMGRGQFFEAIDEETSALAPGSRSATIFGAMLACALFTRATITAAGPFDEELGAAEDIDFFLRLMEVPVPYITETKIALLYRRHSTNMTNNVPLMRRAVADALRRSLERRRRSGGVAPIGDLFRAKVAAQEAFRRG